MSRNHKSGALSRRTLLQAERRPCRRRAVAAGVHAVRPSRSASPTIRRSAPGRPARKGDTVNIGAAVPRTGAYAVQGEDELKGRQLAVEHINSGDPLIKKIAPKVNKGVLGKQVKLRRRRLAPPSRTKRCRSSSASSTRTRSSLMTGSTSSRGRGRAQQVRRAREGALRRWHFRLQRHHRQGLRALLLPPVLLRRDGGERDRPGAGQDLRQEQEGGVHDAGLHLWPHRHQVGERLPDQERRLDAW